MAGSFLGMAHPPEWEARIHPTSWKDAPECLGCPDPCDVTISRRHERRSHSAEWQKVIALIETGSP
jgi:hypothetical protein